MKKLIAIFLTVLLSLGAVTPVIAQEETVFVTESEEAAALLTFLGVIGEDEDLTENITRAEFATYVAKALNQNIISDDIQYYTDVQPGFWAAGAIASLTKLGIFSGGENSQFRPDDNLKYNEACKVMACVLGYGKLGEVKGGYPAGYTELTHRLGISKGIKNADITKKDMCLMLLRTLNCEIYDIASVSGASATYEVVPGKTPLSQYFEIYSVKGNLGAVGAIATDSLGALDENKMRVGKTVIRTDALSVDPYDYLGMTVKAYYIDAQDASYGGVLLFPYEKRNQSVSFKAEELIRPVDSTGSYYTFEYKKENEKAQTVRIPKGCVVIKNGESVTSDLFNEIKILKGTYKFLDNNNDKQYDVLFVNEYYNLTVGQIDNEQGMVYITLLQSSFEYYRDEIGSNIVIYDKFDPSKKVDVTKTRGKIVKYKDASGNVVSIDNISVGEVLSIYKSKSGNYVEVCKGKGIISGTVEAIADDGDKFVLTIGGTEYKMDKTLSAKMKTAVKAGMSGSFSIDMFGEIGYYEETASGILYGYLVKTGYGKGFTKVTEAKIFDQNGKMGIYTIKDNAKIDGEKVKKSADALSAISSHEKQLIRFTADENNAITFVDTQYRDDAKEGKVSIRETLSYGKYVYHSAYRGFEYNQVIRSDAPVFYVPTDAAIDSGSYDDSWFHIRKVSNFTSTSSYYVSTYHADPTGPFEDAVLSKRNGGTISVLSGNPSLVTEIKKGFDEDGNEVDLLTVYEGTKQTYLKTENFDLTPYNIKRGDLVAFEKNVNGDIIGVVEILVDNEATLLTKVENSDASKYPTYWSKKTSTSDGDTLENTNFDSPYCVIYGYAGMVEDNVLKLGATKNDCKNENYQLARILSTNIVVFDRDTDEGGTVYWGGADDIVDYRKGGDDCSLVVIFESRFAPKMYYIYK